MQFSCTLLAWNATFYARKECAKRLNQPLILAYVKIWRHKEIPNSICLERTQRKIVSFEDFALDATTSPDLHSYLSSLWVKIKEGYNNGVARESLNGSQLTEVQCRGDWGLPLSEGEKGHATCKTTMCVCGWVSVPCHQGTWYVYSKGVIFFPCSTHEKSGPCGPLAALWGVHGRTRNS